MRFIIVGGAAATAHGSAGLTQDLDVVYRRDEENLPRLAGGALENRQASRAGPSGHSAFSLITEGGLV